MNGLHKGYSYQDLIAACIMAENLSADYFQINIEFKEKTDDFFDDIVVLLNGEKWKIQVKHSESKSLTKSDFINKSSNLCLSKLASSHQDKTKYFVVTNKPIEVNDLFSESYGHGIFSFSKNLAIINKDKSSVSKNFINNFFIEYNLPNASFDLSNPGELELQLTNILRSKIGIGEFPNNITSVRDVAGRLILLANNLRLRKDKNFVDNRFIAKNIDLKTEFGHIVQNFPFTSNEFRIYRKKVVADLINASQKSSIFLLEGDPGSGKSHVFDELASQLRNNNKVVLTHYCYLEPTDFHSQDRVLFETMYGNFLYQLSQQLPQSKKHLQPYYSATKQNLEKLLKVASETNHEVYLMIDGLDHLSRVVTQLKLPRNTVENFLNNILELNIPSNVKIFIASQPSQELKKIEENKKANKVELKPWNEKMVASYVQKINDLSPEERKLEITDTLISTIARKTEGNPLYLTYTLNEIMKKGSKKVEKVISSLPDLDKNLNNYYEYLINESSDSDRSIICTLALLDFSVTRSEILSMFPPISNKAVNSAIDKIIAILKPGIEQNGLRIYHESFRRFIISKNNNQFNQYQHITDWLQKEGFFKSQRSYRYLIPYLIKSSADVELSQLIKENFIAKSLQFFHSTKSIGENLNKFAIYFSQRNRWDQYCKAVELKRALHTYSNEREEGIDELYQEAILQIMGSDLFCERLTFDGKAVFSKIAGILLCQKAEHLGAAPPWSLYDVTGLKMNIENESDIKIYLKVQAAHFLNKIRNASIDSAVNELESLISDYPEDNTEYEQIEYLLAEFDFVFSITNNYKSLMSMNLSSGKQVILRVLLAQYLYKSANKSDAINLLSDVLGTTDNLDYKLQALKMGVEPNKVRFRTNIEELTIEILKPEHSFSDSQRDVFATWYKSIQIYAHKDPSELDKAKDAIPYVAGWYRAWIYYLINFSIIEASDLSPTVKSQHLLIELRKLSKHTAPFVGNPRACDLWGIREYSKDSFRRTFDIAKNLPNFGAIVALLSTISKETTTYLQGMSGGPLDGEDFNSLLKEVYKYLSNENKKNVESLLKENVVNAEASSVYYDSAAYENMKLALIFLDAGNSNLANEYFYKACIYLGAYGHRKDITLFEIIEPLSALAKGNLSNMVKCAKKVYPLVETVWRYTDKKETRWSLPKWIETIIDADQKIGVFLIKELIEIDNGKDWRVEHATEKLCEKLIESDADILLVAELYKTIDNTRNQDINIEVGLLIVNRLLTLSKIGAANDLFSHLSNTLYLAATYEHVYDRKSFGKIIGFSNEHNLEIETKHKETFLEKLENNENDSVLNKNEDEAEGESDDFSNMSLIELKKVVQEKTTDHVFRTTNAKALAQRLVHLSESDYSGVFDFIIQSVRGSLFVSRTSEGISAMKEVFVDAGANKLAALVAMLGFTHIRGGNGWLSLADDESNQLGIEAYGYSREVAQQTLSSEMAYLFPKSEYFIGPTNHLIRFFSKKSKHKLAISIWEKAFEVINFRLPAHKDLIELLNHETPKMNYDRRKSINSLIFELIETRKIIV